MENITEFDEQEIRRMMENLTQFQNLTERHGVDFDYAYHRRRNILVLVIAIFLMLVSKAALLANIVTLVGIGAIREKLSSHLVFVTSMCSADLIVSLVAAGDEISFLEQHALVVVKYMITTSGFLSSLIHVTVMAVDHYIAIVHPLKYGSLMSRKRAVSVVVGIWMGTLAFGLAQYGLYRLVLHSQPELSREDAGRFWWKAESIAYLVIHIISVVAIVFCYASIWRTLRQAEQTISNQRFAVTSLWIIITFVLFWTPHIVYRIISSFNLYWSPFLMLMQMSPVLNALSDPVIYSVRLPQVKAALRRTCCGTLGCLSMRRQVSTTSLDMETIA